MPLVSIVMPAYNAEKYIYHSIQSVIEQTFDDWELIIVNDGSLDNTDAEVRKFNDSRIKYILQDNKGVSAARNHGINSSCSDLICFLDADDTLPVNSLELRVKYMNENTQCDFLDGGVIVFDETMNSVIKKYVPRYSGKVARRYICLDAGVFFGPNLMFRKRAISTGFDESMTHVEDLWFYTINSWINDINYFSMQNVVYFYRKSSNSAMSNLVKLERGYFQYLSNVASLSSVTQSDLKFLKTKIKSILFKSYFKRFMFYNATKVLFK